MEETFSVVEHDALEDMIIPPSNVLEVSSVIIAST